jgi:glycosyltransferase involved in cell wall biosynthesis
MGSPCPRTGRSEDVHRRAELDTPDSHGVTDIAYATPGSAPLPSAADAGSPRRRVLVLIKCLAYGGAEQLLVHTMRHRDRERFDYEVAYILESENALVPEVEAAGVPVHSLGARSNRDLGWTLRLRALLLRGNYDIVHFHLPYAAVFGRMVALSLPRRRRPALVSTEHTLWSKLAVAWRALNWATIRLDDRVLIVSEAARRTMPQSLQPRTQVVIHGIEPGPVHAVMQQRDVFRRDVRAEFALRDGELLALTVANLRPEKGHDVLLGAARLTADGSLPVRFLAAGDGPMRDELEAELRRLGLGDRFVFAGERSDVLRLMAGADILVLPSRHEGLPVVIMEATTAGMPLVVTAVGELPLLFTDGVDALVVPPGRPEALADAIGTLAGDADLRQRLARGSLTRGELFDVTRCVREIEDVYDEVRPPRALKGS